MILYDVLFVLNKGVLNSFSAPFFVVISDMNFVIYNPITI